MYIYPLHILLHSVFLRIWTVKILIYKIPLPTRISLNKFWRRGVRKITQPAFHIILLFHIQVLVIKDVCKLQKSDVIYLCKYIHVCTFQNVFIRLKSIILITFKYVCVYIKWFCLIAESHLEWNIHLQCGSWRKVPECLCVLQNTWEAWQAE